MTSMAPIPPVAAAAAAQPSVVPGQFDDASDDGNGDDAFVAMMQARLAVQSVKEKNEHNYIK